MNGQRGLSFSGFMLGAFLLVLASVFGLKLIPVYMQHGEIDKIFTEIASDPDMQKASSREIRAAFEKRASIDNVTAIKPEDIEIRTDGGRPALSASYAVKVPLAGNISLYIEFTSASK